MTDSQIKKIYDRELKIIETKIARLLKSKNPKSLYEPCSYIISSGGKRLRPLLVLICAKAVGAEYKKVYNAAIAVELLHNFTLVHDDIMDNSDKRRGRTTVHLKYDLSTAILTGDNLIALAYKNLLLDSDNDAKNVTNTFTQGVIEVCEGQSLDKEFETKSRVTIDEYKTMIKKKTASLAEMCCSIGAQLGDGSDLEIKALSNYGKNLGMAFQIQDDLLDIIGDEKEFGKKVGIDLIEGKKTYLFLRALAKSKVKQKDLLLRVVRNKGIKQGEISKYRNLYAELGVFNDAVAEIKRYSNNALKSLNKIREGEAKELLSWLVLQLIKRNK
ncbi:polyprenyl synthetase family protein [Bacteroidota bacterium]